MLFTFLCLAIFSLATALPGLNRRGLAGAVYTCTEDNFRGNCQWSAPTNQCRQPGPAKYNLGLKSLGPDPGTTCTLYEKFDCSGTGMKTIRFPGLSANMPDFQAFRCAPDGDQTSSTAPNSPAPTSTDRPSSSKSINTHADSRLAGGIGSLERKNHLEEIKRMEDNGFKEGLLGLEKSVYY